VSAGRPVGYALSEPAGHDDVARTRGDWVPAGSASASEAGGGGFAGVGAGAGPPAALPRSSGRGRVGYTSRRCGRFLLFSDGATRAGLFDLAGFPELAPRYNIAPTQPVAAVRAGGAGREFVRLRWGLVAPWAKDTKVAPINARAETAADKPLFRAALRKRRCLIPASGFYEWVALAGEKRKQPYCFRSRDERRPFAFAGLWERWEGPDGPVESCAILTTEANELVRPVHDCMPVILPQQHWAAWLDRVAQDAAALVPLRPVPADAMRAYPVGPLVSNPRNDGPGCLEPA
jgi:putative SOS response-associated peptidase YedK